ncbi:MAG: hypothetical protein HYV97_10080 [Bdellovibrio sp.]|nr:hypothetical protein [Bdellovibrio sp.]
MIIQTTYSEATKQAMANVRSMQNFEWYVIPLLALLIYAYVSEAQNKQWNIFMAGIAGWVFEWLGEFGNMLWCYVSGYAPLWTASGRSAFLILAGINIEISLMFAMYGLVVTKALPKDTSLRIFGLPNRLVVILAFSVFCGVIETCLNAFGVLIWEWHYWGWPHIWTVILFAYIPQSALVVFIHDMKSMRNKIYLTVGLAIFDIVFFVIFAGLLKWM